MAKFGIVVPVYNHSDLLGRCLSSILGQTFQDFNVYCIKDDKGGPKKVETVFREKGGKKFDYTKLKFYADFKHKGLPKRLNESFDYVKDDYWGYFGADDIMISNALENLKNLDKDWCYGGYIDSYGYSYTPPRFNRKLLTKNNYIPGGSVFIRTEIVKKLKFNEDMNFGGEDEDMWKRLVNLSVFRTPTPQYIYVLGRSNFDKKGFNKRYEPLDTVLK